MGIVQNTGLVLIQDPNPTLSQVIGDFAGLPRATLQSYLNQATTALHNLLVNGQATTVSYSSGDGQKSVTYSRTNETALRNHIRELKSVLRIGPGRHALRLGF